MNKDTFRLVVVSAGTSDPSSTRLLADRTADRVASLAASHGHQVTVSVIELREIAADITTALTSALMARSSSALLRLCWKFSSKNRGLVLR